MTCDLTTTFNEMKFLAVICVLFLTVNIMSINTLKTMKKLAKGEECVAEGECRSLCQFEKHQFFPGDNRTLYRDKMSTCLLMTCLDDFYIEFEP